MRAVAGDRSRGGWTAAAEWMHEEAVRLYPTSDYAKRYVR
jgi:hypothetical protein